MTFQDVKAKRILFTGGGSAGHVTPNIALIQLAKNKGWEVAYAGTEKGIERQLVEPLGIPFYKIQSGKLQRRITWQNLLMPWRVLQGIYEAYQLCRRLKPDVVFSKGGFVAVPIVIGAWLNRIPVIAHESDITPGLANKLCYPFVKKIAVSFPESIYYFQQKSKVVYTGTPIRAEMLEGDAARGRAWLDFKNIKPLMLIYGGGLGSLAINQAVWKVLPQLLEKFNIVHCCGKGKTNPTFNGQEAYRQFEYLNHELPDVFTAADIIISRAGANSLYELLSLAKPNLLIPLSKKASRGDQIDNAKYFAREGFSEVLFEENLTSTNLLETIEKLWQERAKYQVKMRNITLPPAAQRLIELVDSQS